MGVVTALLLAQDGWQVKLYDKRPRPEGMPSPEDTQSYLLLLGPRGIKACKAAGVDMRPLAALCNGLAGETQVLHSIAERAWPLSYVAHSAELVFYKPDGREDFGYQSFQVSKGVLDCTCTAGA